MIIFLCNRLMGCFLFCFFRQYLGLHFVYPHLSLDIYNNMPYILGSLNIFAFALCSILLTMGKFRPQSSEKMTRYVCHHLLLYD